MISCAKSEAMRTNIGGIVRLSETSVSITHLIVLNIVVSGAHVQSIRRSVARRNFHSCGLSVVEISITYGVCAHALVADVVTIAVVKHRSRKIQTIPLIFCRKRDLFARLRAEIGIAHHVHHVHHIEVLIHLFERGRTIAVRIVGTQR